MCPPFVKEITSTSNSQVKNWVKLQSSKGRKEQGLILIETDHLIEEAYQSNLLIAQIVGPHYTGEFYVDEVYRVSEAICKKLSMTASLTQHFGLVKITDVTLSGSRFLYCEEITDPGNMGTLIRSALSFGYDGVLCSEGCVDIYNDKVIRASQGAIFHLPVKVMSVNELIRFSQQHQLTLIGSHLKAQNTQALVNDHLILVIGNEARGMSESLSRACNHLVKIETVAFESLNAGVAGSILMYLSRKKD